MAVHHGHANIHEDEVGPPTLELLDGLLPVARQPDLEADGPEDLHQQFAIILDVVGNQHAALFLSGLEAQDRRRLVDERDRLHIALVQGEMDREDASLCRLRS